MICPLCQSEKELLEHHVSYRERFGLFPVEVVLKVCMDCHHRIHNEDGFHNELNPVESDQSSSTKYEGLMAELIDSYNAELDEDTKYRMEPDNSGECQIFTSDGELCGRDLPCRFHGHQWELKPVAD